MLITLFYRCLGIWCRILTVARRTEQAHKWAEGCGQFTCRRYWTSYYCWQCRCTLQWSLQAERHCCKSWCFPHLIRNVENTSRALFHVDRWLSLIWTPQGVFRIAIAFVLCFSFFNTQKVVIMRSIMWTELNLVKSVQLLVNQLEPLTEQQLMGIYNLQQSSQQAEDALSQGMEALQQSLAETLANGNPGSSGSSGNVANYMGQMAMAMGKLGTLEGFLRQVNK